MVYILMFRFIDYQNERMSYWRFVLLTFAFSFSTLVIKLYPKPSKPKRVFFRIVVNHPLLDVLRDGKFDECKDVNYDEYSENKK